MQASRDSGPAGRPLSGALRVAVAGASFFGIAVVAELLGEFWWLFDLANHFRIQIAWGLTLILGTFLLARRRRAALAAAVLLFLQLWLCVPALNHGGGPRHAETR